MANRLALDISMGKDGFDALEATYRNEGLSVGANHMRLFGEEVKLEVNYSDLVLGDRIGQGACSAVNLAYHRITRETFAIKMFNIYDRAQASQLYNEILLLTSFQCDALISLKGAFHDQGCIGVILEFMDRGSLEFLTEPDVEVTENVLAAIAFQIIWGLGYLHYEKQIHRDIKPGNILMNSRGEVKLSDFGISKELDHTTAMSASAIGSYRYMSPERLLGDKYDASADVWSVGITLIELWNKKYPFSHVAETPIHLSGELQRFQLDKILPRNTPISSNMRQFLKSTLEIDHNLRARCLELTQSDWFIACGINGLEDAQETVAQWLKQVDRQKQRKKASAQRQVAPRQGHGHSQSHQRIPSKNAASIVRDICEMSISLDASNKFDMSEMSLSRSHNPFTSSGTFTSQGPGFGNASYHNTSSSAMGGGGGGGNRRIVHQLSTVSADEDEYANDDFENDEEVHQYQEDSKSDGRYSSSRDYKSDAKSNGNYRHK